MMAVSNGPIPPGAERHSRNGRGSTPSYISTVALTPPIDGEKSATTTASVALDAGIDANVEVATKQMYAHLTQDALDKLRAGSAGPLADLVHSILQPDETEQNVAAKLVAVLRSLSREITRLDVRIAVPVVLELLDFQSWSEISPSVTEAYCQFMGVLASGNPRWWSEIANRVIAQFAEPRLDLAPHHSVIARILQLVPTSAAALAAIFAQQFPFKMSPKANIACYVSSLLEVTQYAPDQLRAVWELVVQRLVELDVESIQLFDDDEDNDDGSDSGSEYDSDEDSDDGDAKDGLDADSSAGTDVDSDSDGDAEDDQTFVASGADSMKRAAVGADEPPTKRVRIDDAAEAFGSAGDQEDVTEFTAAELAMHQAELGGPEPIAEKVDVVMTVIMRHLKEKFTTAAVQSGEASPLFIVLLEVFKRQVLPTSTPQAVQFLWFYIAHSHKDMMDAFLVTLLDASMSPALSLNQRQKGMQYIASFVARAKGLSRTQIVFVVSYLAGWVQRYVAEREHEVDETLSMARFRMFYSAVQALFYIFCFRRSELRTQPGAAAGDAEDAAHSATPADVGEWEAGLDKVFQSVIMTKFNPLKYCESSVVSMFAQVSCDEGIAYCFTILERNRVGRVRADASKQSSSSDLSRLSSVLWPNYRDFKLLERYFPFDPVSLKNVSTYVAPLYIEWGDVSQGDSGTELDDAALRDSSSDESDA